MTDIVKLLSPPSNYAVVQLPGRKFPGIVFQGDSLHILSYQLKKVRDMAEKMKNLELNSELEEVCGLIDEIVTHYENVCNIHGIKLPYER